MPVASLGQVHFWSLGTHPIDGNGIIYNQRSTCVIILFYFSYTALPRPTEVYSFCMENLITVWSPPPGRIDIYAGYDVLYFNPSTGYELMFQKRDNEFFHRITEKLQDLGKVFVKVAIIDTHKSKGSSQNTICMSCMRVLSAVSGKIK